MKRKTTIIMTREYEEGRLVYRKTEIIRTKDATPPEADTKYRVTGFLGGRAAGDSALIYESEARRQKAVCPGPLDVESRTPGPRSEV